MKTKVGSLLVRNFFIFSLLLLLCMLSLGFYGLQANRDIEKADNWVSHTQHVIIETQGIMTAMHQMLAAQRGYLLTGDQDFVARYDGAKQRVLAQIDKVQALMADSSTQELHMEELRGNVQRFAQTLEQAFDQAPTFPDGVVLANKQVVNELRNEIIAASQRLLDTEYALLNTRAEALESKTKNYQITLLVGGAGSALLLLLLNIFLLRAQAERTHVERSLKETEDRLALAIRGSNSGVFDMNLINGELYWSPQYKLLLGYTDDELPSHTNLFEEILHPDDRERVLHTYQQYINENLSEYFDIFRMRHKSGRWVWIQAKGMGLFDEKGRATRFIGTHTDISHLKDYERRLEEEKERAEKANAAKSEFLAHMSHEIRTPLTAISGIAEILINMQEDLDEKQRKLIHTLSSSATSLKDLISDILDFSKIESGEIEINERQFSLGNLFEQVLSITAVRAAEKQLDYTFDYSTLVEENFYGDQARLRQILINLIGNAIKFTDKGYVHVTAEFETIDKIPTMTIRVEDTGIGIERDSQEIIFEKFRQADASVSRKYGGTGLGLPISKRLVELMDGTIKVESVPDKGSTFTLYLPVKEKASFYGASMSAPSDSIGEQKQRERLKNALEDTQKILLVEDYEGNIVVLAHLLEEMGYAYDVARTGKEALACWKENYYNLILMDVQMPEMDGLSATEAIRRMESDEAMHPTPIIGLTAHALVADREKCIAAGMNSYLPKPIDEAELKKTIQRYIQKQPGKESRAA